MNEFLDIFANPKSLFSAQKDDSNWWKPALVAVLIAVLSGLIVTSQVDQAAIAQAAVDAQIQTMKDAGVPEESIAAMEDAAEQSAQLVADANPLLLYGGEAAATVLAFLFLLVVLAFYYWIVGKIVGTEDIFFSDWLALVSWGKLPATVVGGVVIAIVALLMSTNTDPNAFNIFAIAAYIDLPGSVGNLANPISAITAGIVWSLDVLVIWSVVLMTIGFREFTGKSTGVSAAVVLGPYVVFYGLFMLL